MSQVVYRARELKRARYAVATVFCVHGAVTGSFATRVPWIQDHAGVSAGQLGIALAFPALGASVAMPLAGWVSHRFGARTALRGLLALWTLALILPSLAPNLAVLCVALFAYGASAGMSDVAMNALGVEVENRLDRSIMSSLHGMWSVGALIGSAAGTLAAHLGSDARLHHLLAAATLTAVGFIACGGVLDLHPTEDEEPPPRFALPPRSALLIGAVGFCAVFAEGRAWTGRRSICGTSSTRPPDSRPRAPPRSRSRWPWRGSPATGSWTGSARCAPCGSAGSAPRSADCSWWWRRIRRSRWPVSA